jgi:flagellar motor switch protein FliN
VKVPVSVTLAAKKQPLKQILELAPGSLIQFSKSCDETLDLCVGEHCIAKGLAIKVGEKFGLRVNALTPPGERFQAVRP